MSPAGTSVLAPMCLLSSAMKALQNLRISLSDLPLGSKSAPPLPPPMFTEITAVLVGPFFTWYCVEVTLTASQSVLEDLLKAQELENRQVYGRVKAETAFVWTQSRVELNSIAPIDLDQSFVIFPNHTKLNHSFGDGGNLEGDSVFRVLFKEGGILEGGGEL